MRSARSPVRPAPVPDLLRAAPSLLAVGGPMALLAAGRLVCLAAQRVPPLVAIVRAVRRTQARLSARNDVAELRSHDGGGPPAH